MPSHISKPESMIFDLDGTLFQTESIILSAFAETFAQLRKEGLYQNETPPASMILGSLGMLLQDIFHRLMPDSSQEVRNRADEILLKVQLEKLQHGEGMLFPFVHETLTILHQRGVRLFVASNGLEPYVQSVIKQKNLSHLFESIYSAGKYQTKSKVDLVRMLLEKHQMASAWMVGDRSSDLEAGLKNHLTVIGCAYAGFCEHDELQGSTHIIYQFDEILALYEKA